MLLNCGVGEDSWESLGLQRDSTSPTQRKLPLNIHWKNWCWSWNSNTLVTWRKELTHWKRPWCWERLKAGGEGDDRGWDGWNASLTRWTWTWVSSRSWWWTGNPGMLQSMGLQRVRHDWVTELNWAELDKSGESSDLCLPPDLRGKVFSLLPLSMVWDFCRCILSSLRSFPLFQVLWKFLS